MVPGGCRGLDGGHQALMEPWQDQMVLDAKDTEIWDFAIFQSGWGCTTPDGSSSQLGSSPELTAPAQRSGGSHS